MPSIPDNALVRFHAYSGANWVIGHMDESQNGYGAAVLRPLSHYNDSTTLWRTKYVPNGFSLRWGADEDGGPGQLRLGFGDQGDPLRLSAQFYSAFTTDYLDDTWFALNNRDHSQVADIDGDNIGDGVRILSYPWHGGDNQKWRVEVVG
jgi:hypothetical protein